MPKVLRVILKHKITSDSSTGVADGNHLDVDPMQVAAAVNSLVGTYIWLPVLQKVLQWSGDADEFIGIKIVDPAQRVRIARKPMPPQNLLVREFQFYCRAYQQRLRWQRIQEPLHAAVGIWEILIGG